MILRPAHIHTLNEAVDALDTVHVAVVGDVMLDRYVYGSAARLSPEAPVPVVRQARVDEMPGGAANVAMNLLAYGAQATLIGVIGDDREGAMLETLCADETRLTGHLIRDPHRPTTVKTRIVAQAQQMMRLDAETSGDIDDTLSAKLIAAARKALGESGALILSDYGKGVLTPAVCAGLIAAAAEAGVPVLVDPKRSDLGVYGGADLISPNARELAAITGLPVDDADAAARACAAVLERFGDIGAVLATRGEAGMTLLKRGDDAVHVAAEARSVFDVSGAGDTVIATIAAGLAAGLSLTDAVRLGNAAAGIAVGKAGTSTVSREELRHGLGIDPPHRPVSRQRAAAMVAGWQAAGRQVGFTNGCFDLLHAGHLHSLEYARSRCDALVVGVNSDASVRALKGEGRPAQDAETRARLLASLRFCDLVTVFEEDTPLELITALQPDVIFKGADYAEHEVVGRDVVAARGGRVELIPLLEGHSTSRLVAKLGKRS